MMTIQNVVEEFGLEIITLGVKCQNCGHTWGIRITPDLPEHRFRCTYCGNNHKNGEQSNEHKSIVG